MENFIKILLLFCLAYICNGTPLNSDVRVSDYLNVVNVRNRRAFNEEDEGARRNKTMLCDEVKLKSVVEEHASCYRKAEMSMVNKIASSSFRDSLCKVISDKVDCINLHAPKCLAPERVDLMRKNFLSMEISRSKSNKETLGQAFVNSCRVLSDYQADFVKATFGSDVCTYDQIYNLTDSREDCKVEALDKKQKREMIALDFLTNLDKESKRSILFQLYCDFQWDWLACYENTTFVCTSEEMKKEILDKEKNDFKYIEENFKQIGIHFEFQECSNYTSNAIN